MTLGQRPEASEREPYGGWGRAYRAEGAARARALRPEFVWPFETRQRLLVGLEWGQ